MDLRPPEVIDVEYDAACFRGKECQELDETVIIYECPSNFWVFDFDSLTKGQCLIVDWFRHFGMMC